MSEPDFTRLADVCVARVYLLAEANVVAEQLRQVWHAAAAAENAASWWATVAADYCPRGGFLWGDLGEGVEVEREGGTP